MCLARISTSKLRFINTQNPDTKSCQKYIMFYTLMDISAAQEANNFPELSKAIS